MLKLQKMLSTIEASITAMTLMAFLMGVYFASFLLCLRWLIFSDDGGTLRKPIHRPSLIITIILFVFSVTNVGLCLPRTLLFSQGTSIFSPLLYPNETINVRNPIIELVMGWTLQMFLEISGSIITDGVLVCEWTRLITGCSWQDQIFRCWTVYNRSWRIVVLPFLFLLYSIASLLMLVYWNITNPSGDRWGKIMASYYVTTITINIYATCEWIDCATLYDINLSEIIKLLLYFESGELVCLDAFPIFQFVLLPNRVHYTLSRALSLLVWCFSVPAMGIS